MSDLNTRALRWGLCCAGNIAGEFATGVNCLPKTEHQLAAVAARDLDKAKTFAEKHGVAQAYGSYEELAQDGNIDVVYISSIHPYHASLSKLFLEAGKPVLCEKPVTMNVRDTKEVLELAKEKGLFFMEGFWSRFFPVYDQLRQALKDKLIGDVKVVTANFGFGLTHAADHPSWELGNMEAGSGSLLALGCYCIMFSNLVFDGEKPNKVIAHGNVLPTGEDVTASITLQYSGNRTAHLISSFDCSLDNDACIGGTKGKIIVREFYRSLKMDLNGEIFEDNGIENAQHGFKYEAMAVRECLLKGETQCPLMSHADSLAIMEIMDEVRRQIGVRYAADKQ